MVYTRALEFIGMVKRVEPTQVSAYELLDYLREVDRGEAQMDQKLLDVSRKTLMGVEISRPSERMEGLYLVAKQFYHAGRLSEGMLPARMALSIAQGLRDTSLASKVQLLLGNMLLSEGVYDLAGEQLLEANIRAEAAKDKATAVAALNALGAAWQCQGMNKQAREAYEKVYTACKSSGALFEPLMTAMIQLCWCAYQMHDYDNVMRVARPVLRKALKITGSESAVLPRIEMQTQLLKINMARLAVELKNFDEAEQWLKSVKPRDQDFGARRINISRLSVEGALLVRQGQLRSGLSKVEQAVKQSKFDQIFLHENEIIKARTLHSAGKVKEAALLAARIKEQQRRAAAKSSDLYRKQSTRDLLALDKAASRLPAGPDSNLISQIADEIRHSIMHDPSRLLSQIPK